MLRCLAGMLFRQLGTATPFSVPPLLLEKAGILSWCACEKHSVARSVELVAVARVLLWPAGKRRSAYGSEISRPLMPTS